MVSLPVNAGFVLKLDFWEKKIICIDVVHRPTPETCDDSVFNIG